MIIKEINPSNEEIYENEVHVNFKDCLNKYIEKPFNEENKTRVHGFTGRIKITKDFSVKPI